MCGITGMFSAAPLPHETEHQLNDMMDAINHRGPDGRGRHINHEEGIAMGHTRLSIIDLETGEQPIHSADNRYTLTVNGEFYDFKKYRVLLMAGGDRFTTKSDSEIAVHLYQKMGMDFLEHLRGEFAFALYDRKEEKLILVRDRFGIRPMFFHVNNDTLYYGSEVKALLRHPRVPKRLDRQSVLNQLMHTMVPGVSAFEDVHALMPGHFLVAQKRNGRLEVETHQYWDMDFPLAKEREQGIKPEFYINQVLEELSDAIIQRLVADVPVGCYLSGGIDSCCILGLATGAQQSPVKAFTISFDHADYDEFEIAKEMAKSMKADQVAINLKAADLYGDSYLRTVWHAERTFYNTLGVAKYHMSKRVWDSGYKTVITGEGSDELFGGYPAFKRDMFLHGLHEEPPELRKELEEALEKSNKLFKGAILTEQDYHHPAFDDICGFTPSWIQSWLGTLELAKPLLSDEMRDELGDYDPVAAIAEKLDPDAIKGRHPLDKAQYTWSKTMLEGQILNWGGDRVDMANSMESRPAFLDHNVAEAAMRVPPRYRIHGNIEKWVLREAVKGVLPEVLYKREKFAFMAPPAHTDELKQQKLKELTDEYLNEDAVKDAGLFDPKQINRFMTEYHQAEDPVLLTRKDALLNHLICLQALHRQYIAGDGTPTTIDN